jgi:AGCS family alanine or glycine:cation symporter
VREGLVAMMEPFIDTIVICTMTGLVIVISGAHLTAAEGVVGAALTAYAFNLNFGDFGAMVVGLGLSLFAFSTMIAWSYYGDRSARFLFGKQAVVYYRFLFTIVIIVGAAVPLKLVWNIADITTILMALPNLLALFLLASLVQRMKTDYFGRVQGLK